MVVKGPRGELTQRVHPEMRLVRDETVLRIERPTDEGFHRSLHGLTRSLIANMVEGVTGGFEKRLEIQGVGYRAQLQGNKLVLALGYSHPVEITAPQGVEFEVPEPTRIVVRGISKQVVGETAANIRKIRAWRAQAAELRTSGITRRARRRRASLHDYLPDG